MDTNLFDSLAHTDGDGNTYWSARDLAAAMNCAPNMPQVAAAQAYFAVQTHYAEQHQAGERVQAPAPTAGTAPIVGVPVELAESLVGASGGMETPLTSAFYVITNTLSRDNSRQRFPYQCTMGA